MRWCTALVKSGDGARNQLSCVAGSENIVEIVRVVTAEKI